MNQLGGATPRMTPTDVGRMVFRQETPGASTQQASAQQASAQRAQAQRARSAPRRSASPAQRR